MNAPDPVFAGYASKRQQLLDEAARIVGGQRATDYGKAEDTFGLIANLWAQWLNVPITPSDVIAMMALLKLARLNHNPSHRDSIVDLAGYAACWAELLDAPSEAE